MGISEIEEREERRGGGKKPFFFSQQNAGMLLSSPFYSLHPYPIAERRLAMFFFLFLSLFLCPLLPPFDWCQSLSSPEEEGGEEEVPNVGISSKSGRLLLILPFTILHPDKRGKREGGGGGRSSLSSPPSPLHPTLPEAVGGRAAAAVAAASAAGSRVLEEGGAGGSGGFI